MGSDHVTFSLEKTFQQHRNVLCVLHILHKYSLVMYYFIIKCCIVQSLHQQHLNYNLAYDNAIYIYIYLFLFIQNNRSEKCS